MVLLQVKVGFCISSDLLTYLDSLEVGGCHSDGDGEVRLEAHGMERKLLFTNNLRVTFSNTMSQVYYCSYYFDCLTKTADIDRLIHYSAVLE